jgi:hypothetical protein
MFKAAAASVCYLIFSGAERLSVKKMRKCSVKSHRARSDLWSNFLLILSFPFLISQSVFTHSTANKSLSTVGSNPSLSTPRGSFQSSGFRESEAALSSVSFSQNRAINKIQVSGHSMRSMGGDFFSVPRIGVGNGCSFFFGIHC